MVRSIFSLPFFTLLLAFALVTTGCETSIDPILESDRNFSIYGTLDMNQDTQYVRVVPIRETFDPGDPAPLDITFISRDLTTGAQMAWRDSVVTFSNGTFGHVFYAPLRLQGGHNYRVEITDPATGIITSAETTMPALPQAVVSPEVVTGTIGGFLQGSQKISWQGIDREPFRVEAWYRFIAADRGAFVDIQLPYEPSYTIGAGAMDVTLDLRKDRNTLDTLTSVSMMPLAGVGMTVVMLDEDFVPPGGVFDPEVLSQPGVFNNVENGFGYVGSVGRFSVEWLFSPDTMAKLAFRTIEDGVSKYAPPRFIQSDGSQRPVRTDVPPGPAVKPRTSPYGKGTFPGKSRPDKTGIDGLHAPVVSPGR